MAIEARTGTAGRPRSWLLMALAAAAGLYLVSWLAPDNSAAPAAAPSRPRAATTKSAEAIEPADLKVRLEALTVPRPETKGGDRNPFTFYVKPLPPPPPPVVPQPFRPAAPVVPAGPPPDSGQPPPPPPIAMRYIGLMETPSGKIANFSDCRSTYRAREGDIIAGQFRLVRIGNESVVLEYPDGRGRTTIRVSGQECVGK